MPNRGLPRSRGRKRYSAVILQPGDGRAHPPSQDEEPEVGRAVICWHRVWRKKMSAAYVPDSDLPLVDVCNVKHGRLTADHADTFRRRGIRLAHPWILSGWTRAREWRFRLHGGHQCRSRGCRASSCFPAIILARYNREHGSVSYRAGLDLAGRQDCGTRYHCNGISALAPGPPKRVFSRAGGDARRCRNVGCRPLRELESRSTSQAYGPGSRRPV